MSKNFYIAINPVEDAQGKITSTFDSAATWGNSVAIGMMAILMAIGIINYLLFKE